MSKLGSGIWKNSNIFESYIDFLECWDLSLEFIIPGMDRGCTIFVGIYQSAFLTKCSSYRHFLLIHMSKRFINHRRRKRRSFWETTMYHILHFFWASTLESFCCCYCCLPHMWWTIGITNQYSHKQNHNQRTQPIRTKCFADPSNAI